MQEFFLKFAFDKKMSYAEKMTETHILYVMAMITYSNELSKTSDGRKGLSKVGVLYKVASNNGFKSL